MSGARKFQNRNLIKLSCYHSVSSLFFYFIKENHLWDFNLRSTQRVILTHTPTLTENSVRYFKKRRDRNFTAVVRCSKKKFFSVNFFKYQKDFRGTYNIYKLLKKCWKYTSEFSWVKRFSSCGIISDKKWTGSDWTRVFAMVEKIGVSSGG